MKRIIPFLALLLLFSSCLPENDGPHYTFELRPITSVEINKLIMQVKRRYKTSSIVITHDLACAKQTGDRILMMVDGKFIKEGDFEEVFETEDETIQGFYDYNFTQ